MDPILIVDDEKDNLDALFRIFRSQYDVTTTSSPFDALKMIQKKNFHVIISDQRMPEMTGVELLEKAKQVVPNTVRILLTGYTDIESVIDAINRGHIYRYVAKPWDPEDLKITVRQANENFRIRTELDEKNRALEKAFRDLQSLDRMKSRFLSLVSHELNTPLTVLTSFLSILKDPKNQFAPDIKKAVDSLGDATSRLEEIVSEVVAYLKVQAGLSLDKKSTPFSKLVDKAVENSKKILSKRNLKVASSGKSTASVLADPERLKTAIEKIFFDVGHRAREKSELKLGIMENDKGCILHLEYDGTPVEKEAFEAMDPTANQGHHHRNMGLALATARAIIEEHGGKMTSSSGKRNSVGFEVPKVDNGT